MCNTRGVSGVSGVGCALFFFGGVLSVREGCAFSIIHTHRTGKYSPLYVCTKGVPAAAQAPIDCSLFGRIIARNTAPVIQKKPRLLFYFFKSDFIMCFVIQDSKSLF